MPVGTKATTATGAGGGVGLGVIIVWLAGYLGAEIPVEVAAVIGGGATAVGAAVGAYGIVGIVRRILFGPPKVV